MAGQPLEPDHHARVLAPPGGIEQPRAHHPDVGLDRVLDQRLDEVVAHHLGVVVEKEQELRLCVRCSKIIDRREVEPLRPAQHPRPPAPLELAQIVEHLRLVRAIVDREDLAARIARPRVNRFDAAPEQLHPIAKRNDDRHARPISERASHRHRRRPRRPRLKTRGNSPPRDRRPHHLHPLPRRRRRRRQPPLIDQLPEVRRRPELACAQREIVERGGRLERRRNPAHPLDHFAPNEGELPGVRKLQRQLRRPVGLEPRPERRAPRVEQSLVGVDERRPRPREQRSERPLDRPRQERIPRKHDPDHLAPRRSEQLRQPSGRHPHPRVIGKPRPPPRHHLPFPIRLLDQRLDGERHPPRRPRRQDEAHQRPLLRRPPRRQIPLPLPQPPPIRLLLRPPEQPIHLHPHRRHRPPRKLPIPPPPEQLPRIAHLRSSLVARHDFVLIERREDST